MLKAINIFCHQNNICEIDKYHKIGTFDLAHYIDIKYVITSFY